jgi:hypothetical protein
MALSRFFSVCGLIGAVSIGALAACSGDKPADVLGSAGEGGAPAFGTADNPGSAGTPAADSGGAGSAGLSHAGTGGAGTAGPTAGAGGSTAGAGGSTAGAGGSTAGASGSTAGAAAGGGGTGEATAGAGGQTGDAGMPEEAEDDPFDGIFGPLPISCDGLLCLEDSDCASLYPDETAACKLTKCVDFVCQ